MAPSPEAAARWLPSGPDRAKSTGSSDWVPPWAAGAATDEPSGHSSWLVGEESTGAATQAPPTPANGIHSDWLVEDPPFAPAPPAVALAPQPVAPAPEPVAPAPEPVAPPPKPFAPAPEPVAPPAAGEAARWIAGPSPAPAAPADWLSEPPTETNGQHAPVVDERAAQAAHAYCRELCGHDAGSAVAEGALAGFAASGAVGTAALLAHTRTSAAEHLAADSSLAAGPQCAETPTLLAARDNGTLGHADLDRLGSHLEGCVACQGTELRAARAERMFGAVAPEAAHPSGTTMAWTAGAGAAGAATGAAAGAGAGVAAGAASRTATGTSPSGRRPSRPLIVLAAVLAALVVAGAVLLATKSNNSKAPPLPRVSAPAVSQPTTATVQPARTHHRRAAVHRVVHHKAKPAHHKAAAKPVTSVASAPPVTTVAPVTSATPPPVTPSTPPPSNPTPSSGSTLTQGSSGGSLPPASGPTSTIGSSTKH